MMKRYLATSLALCALLMLLAATLVVAVDPYRLYHGAAEPGWAPVKPKAGPNGAMSKAYHVLRARPGGLILGNSRAEVGFDPAHPAWPDDARPIYNLALPGTGVRSSHDYLLHVLTERQQTAPDRPLRTVLLGLDLMDYLVEAQAPAVQGGEGSTDPAAARLHGASSPALGGRTLRQLRDYAQSTLTMGALFDALQTLAAQRDPYAADLDAQGFNPMRDYIKIAADEGYWRLFRQKDLANSRSFARRPTALIHADGREGAPLRELRKILALCRERGIDLRLVIYPYHAHLLEIIAATGHWPTFEQWKRQLVRLVDEEGRGTVALWDFSGFDSHTAEAVPPPGDRRTTMRWYWEAGHFKRELGDQVLARVFGEAAAEPGFGVRLDAGNVEAHIVGLQAQREAYRAAHPADVRDIAEIVAAQFKK